MKDPRTTLDDFDELRDAWRRLVEELKAAGLEVVVRTAYRVMWAVDRVRHG